MIRAIGTDEKSGARVVVVGLSAENVKRLKDNEPILAEYPDGSRVLVLYGDTEDDVTEDLRAMGWLR